MFVLLMALEFVLALLIAQSISQSAEQLRFRPPRLKMKRKRSRRGAQVEERKGAA